MSDEEWWRITLKGLIWIGIYCIPAMIFCILFSLVVRY
jgi:hypothetical protein